MFTLTTKSHNLALTAREEKTYIFLKVSNSNLDITRRNWDIVFCGINTMQTTPIAQTENILRDLGGDERCEESAYEN